MYSSRYLGTRTCTLAIDIIAIVGTYIYIVLPVSHTLSINAYRYSSTGMAIAAIFIAIWPYLLSTRTCTRTACMMSKTENECKKAIYIYINTGLAAMAMVGIR